MITILRGTEPEPAPLQLDRVFSVERVLASRGFRVRDEGDGANTLLAKTTWTAAEADLVFGVFDDTALRRQLRDFIRGQSEAEADAVRRLIALDAFMKDEHRFATTFEWYVGELLMRRFGAFSSSYGVTVGDVRRNADDGEAGDYDVLSILGDMNLLYVECKSGATDQAQIVKAIERGHALHCIATVIVVEKITEKVLTGLLSMAYPNVPSVLEAYKISLKGRANCAVYKWFNCYFLFASKQIEGQLQTVLRLIEYARIGITQSTEPSEESYAHMGYTVMKLDTP